jgi:hypothetical protein
LALTLGPADAIWLAAAWGPRITQMALMIRELRRTFAASMYPKWFSQRYVRPPRSCGVSRPRTWPRGFSIEYDHVLTRSRTGF